ncbi:MAG: hypothetical protein KDA75_13385, partial [Planctomycetaceae bacterium]|nr:hypothetical protein [Planctomycetaceae bacterium]
REALRMETQQQRQRWESAQTELNTREQQLRERQSDLEQARAEWEVRSREFEQQCRRFEEDAAEREATLSSRERDVAERLSSLKIRQSNHSERETELAATSAQLEAERSELDGVRQRLTTSREELEQTEAEVAAEKRRLQSQRQALEERTEAATAEWRKLKSERETLAQEGALLRSRAEEFEQRETDMRVRQRELDVKRTELERRQKQLGELATELERRAETIEARAAELGSSQTEADRLRRAEEERQLAAREQMESERQHLAAERVRLAEQESELNARLSAINGDELVSARDAEVQLATERSRADEAEQRVSGLVQELETVQLQLTDLSERQTLMIDERDSDALAEVEAKLAESEERLSQLRAEFDVQSQALDERASELDAREGALAGRERDLAEAAARADETPEHVATGEADLDAAARIAELACERDEFRSEMEELRRQVRQLEDLAGDRSAQLDDQVAVSEKEREEFEAERRALAQDAVDLQALRNDLESTAEQLRTDAEEVQAEWVRIEAERAALDEQRVLLDEQLTSEPHFHESPAAPEEQFDATANSDRSLAAADRDSSLAEVFEGGETSVTEYDLFEDSAPPTSQESVEVQATDQFTAEESLIFDVGGNDPAPVEEELADEETSSGVAELDRSEAELYEANGELSEEASEGESADREADFAREAAEPEAEPPVREPAGKPASGGAIRSQLAALFGLSADELAETERRHQEDWQEPAATPAAATPAEEVAVIETAAPTQASSSEPAETREEELPVEGEADSVAAYMERLLSRTNAAVPVVHVPPKKPESKVKEPQESAPVVEVQSVENSPAVAGEDEGRKSRGARRLDQQGIAEMRANIDSMREIANLSARSAVAVHYSRKLAVTYQVKLILTIVGGVIAAVLLSAEFWTSNSYWVPGICSLVVTLISGLELVRTSIQMRRVKQIVNGGKSDETDDEAPEANVPAESTETSE